MPAGADAEADVVRGRPAHDRPDVRGVERLRDRAGEHVVEARIPGLPGSGVAGLARPEQRAADGAVELVERLRRACVGREPERERSAGAHEASAPDDEPAPVVPLHGRSVDLGRSSASARG